MPNVFVSFQSSVDNFEKFLKIFIPLCVASIIFFLALIIWALSL